MHWDLKETLNISAKMRHFEQSSILTKRNYFYGGAEKEKLSKFKGQSN